MATMNITLPDPLKEWVEAQARSGRYSNSSDYVRDLIRKDQERETRHRELQKAIDQGLKSGIGNRSKDDLLKLARAKAR